MYGDTGLWVQHSGGRSLHSLASQSRQSVNELHVQWETLKKTTTEEDIDPEPPYACIHIHEHILPSHTHNIKNNKSKPDVVVQGCSPTTQKAEAQEDEEMRAKY